jgi:hypothetical protein
MKRLHLLLFAIPLFGQETVSFDLIEPDVWQDAFGLFVFGLIAWSICAALVRLSKGRPKVETPRLLVPKD